MIDGLLPEMHCFFKKEYESFYLVSCCLILDESFIKPPLTPGKEVIFQSRDHLHVRQMIILKSECVSKHIYIHIDIHSVTKIHRQQVSAASPNLMDIIVPDNCQQK